MKQLGTATGIIGLVDHGINFIRKPNWKDGLEFGGQLGLMGLKVAFPEAAILNVVEFGFNNGTAIFDMIWDHTNKK